MQIFKQLKEFFWPYRKYFIGSILSLIFVTGLTVVYPIFLQLAIDEGIVNQNYSLIPILSIGFIFVMMLKQSQHFSINIGGICSAFKPSTNSGKDCMKSCNFCHFAITIMLVQAT